MARTSRTAFLPVREGANASGRCELRARKGRVFAPRGRGA